MRTLLNFWKIYQTYRKHTDDDPQAPENVQMVNMIFIGQYATDIRKKLQSLHGTLGMNPSQLADIAFKFYNGQEPRKIMQVFLETGWQDEKRQDPEEKKERPTKYQSMCLL